MVRALLLALVGASDSHALILTGGGGVGRRIGGGVSGVRGQCQGWGWGQDWGQGQGRVGGQWEGMLTCSSGSAVRQARRRPRTIATPCTSCTGSPPNGQACAFKMCMHMHRIVHCMARCMVHYECAAHALHMHDMHYICGPPGRQASPRTLTRRGAEQRR